VLKIFSCTFITSYSGLITALHKCTAAHRYWNLENWCIARRTFLRFTSKSFLSFLNGRGPWRNLFEEKRRTRNERIKIAALEHRILVHCSIKM